MADIIQHLQNIQQQVNDVLESINVPQPTRNEPETFPRVIRILEEKVTKQLKHMEHNLMLQSEEQILAMGVVICIFVLCALYVVYFLINNMLYIRRCKCPNVDWQAIVAALGQHTTDVPAPQQPRSNVTTETV